MKLRSLFPALGSRYEVVVLGFTSHGYLISINGSCLQMHSLIPLGATKKGKDVALELQMKWETSPTLKLSDNRLEFLRNSSAQDIHALIVYPSGGQHQELVPLAHLFAYLEGCLVMERTLPVVPLSGMVFSIDSYGFSGMGDDCLVFKSSGEEIHFLTRCKFSQFDYLSTYALNCGQLESIRGGKRLRTEKENEGIDNTYLVQKGVNNVNTFSSTKSCKNNWFFSSKREICDCGVCRVERELIQPNILYVILDCHKTILMLLGYYYKTLSLPGDVLDSESQIIGPTEDRCTLLIASGVVLRHKHKKKVLLFKYFFNPYAGEIGVKDIQDLGSYVERRSRSFHLFRLEHCGQAASWLSSAVDFFVNCSVNASIVLQEIFKCSEQLNNFSVIRGESLSEIAHPLLPISVIYDEDEDDNNNDDW